MGAALRTMDRKTLRSLKPYTQLELRRLATLAEFSDEEVEVEEDEQDEAVVQDNHWDRPIEWILTKRKMQTATRAGHQ